MEIRLSISYTFNLLCLPFRLGLRRSMLVRLSIKLELSRAGVLGA
jgi:hypothetical protein